jgi:histidinol-phosphate aminotransferase
VRARDARRQQVVPNPSASFVRLDTGMIDARIRLQQKGFAVRRGETFSGLCATWISVEVRDDTTSNSFVAALREVIEHD